MPMKWQRTLVPVDDITGEYSYQRGQLRYGFGTSFAYPNSISGIEQIILGEKPSSEIQLAQPFVEDEDLLLH